MDWNSFQFINSNRRLSHKLSLAELGRGIVVQVEGFFTLFRKNGRWHVEMVAQLLPLCLHSTFLNKINAITAKFTYIRLFGFL